MKFRLKFSLRLKFILYLALVHLLFAGVAIYLISKHRLWLLAVEAAFVISLAAGIGIIRKLFGAIEMINTGAQFIEDSDFTSRFREVGQPEMDHLVRVYNRMADSLREERVRAFMRNFADVFRLPPPNLQLCDVRSLIEDAAFLFKTECAMRRIEIVWDAQTELEPVRSDRSQMEQVFVNVLKNAIEAINGAGKITIRLGKQAGRSFVVIEDTGCGIAPAARANLFTPFFSTKDNGQGIGLTLVQEILDQHGFEFSLESQPGQPTEFTVYF